MLLMSVIIHVLLVCGILLLKLMFPTLNSRKNVLSSIIQYFGQMWVMDALVRILTQYVGHIGTKQ